MTRFAKKQRVLKDSTETIETYPPVLAQASGTPTARIGTAAVGVPSAGSNASVDSFSTSLTAAASQGDKTLTISSATTVRGRRYLVVLTTGEIIPVTSEKSATGTTFYLAEPLPMAVPSASTVVGWRISIALTSAQTASVGRGKVEWTATLDGVSEKWWDPFDVVEFDAGYTLTADILLASSPYAKRLRHEDDDDFSEAIDVSWRRYLLPALLAKGIRPNLIVSRDEVEAAHIAAVEHHLAQQFEDDAQQRAERKAEYVEALNLALSSADTWIAQSDGSTNVPDENAPRPWSTTAIVR